MAKKLKSATGLSPRGPIPRNGMGTPTHNRLDEHALMMQKVREASTVTEQNLLLEAISESVASLTDEVARLRSEKKDVLDDLMEASVFKQRMGIGNTTFQKYRNQGAFRTVQYCGKIYVIRSSVEASILSLMTP